MAPIAGMALVLVLVLVLVPACAGAGAGAGVISHGMLHKTTSHPVANDAASATSYSTSTRGSSPVSSDPRRVRAAAAQGPREAREASQRRRQAWLRKRKRKRKRKRQRWTLDVGTRRAGCQRARRRAARTVFKRQHFIKPQLAASAQRGSATTPVPTRGVKTGSPCTLSRSGKTQGDARGSRVFLQSISYAFKSGRGVFFCKHSA